MTSILSGLNSFLLERKPSKAVDRFLAITSKEGPAAVLPLEGAVLAGRSAAAAKRTGLLEFQERLSEELMVAVIWITGVPILGNLFLWGKNKFLPGMNHLNVKTAWKGLKKKSVQSVDLNSQELVTKNFSEVKKLLKMKGAKWLFSVGGATFGVSILIPWFVKRNTEWFVKTFYKDKGLHGEKSVEAPKPSQPTDTLSLTSPQATQNLMAPRYPQQAGQQAVPLARSYPVAYPANQPPSQLANQVGYAAQPSFAQNARQVQGVNAAINQATDNVKPPQFAGGLNMLQLIGHSIEQTPYGPLIAVDVPLTAGRAKMYGERSKFEAAEVVLRDVVSLYFYMFMTPHFMKALNKVSQKALEVPILLQPQVTNLVANNLFDRLMESNTELKSAIESAYKSNPDFKAALASRDLREVYKLTLKDEKLKGALEAISIDRSELEAVVEGSHSAILKDNMSPKGKLSQQFRTANLQSQKGVGNNFTPRLNLELSAYDLPNELQDDVLKFFKDRGVDTVVDTDVLNDLIQALEKGHGFTDNAAVSSLSSGQKADLVTAVKQAFRASVGVPLEMADASASTLHRLLNKLPDGPEKKAFIERLTQMGAQDSRDLAAGLFRRNATLARQVLGEQMTPELITMMETYSEWMDTSVARKQPLAAVIQEELTALADDVKALKLKGDFDFKNLGLKSVDSIDGLIDGIKTGDAQALTQVETLYQSVSKRRLKSMSNVLMGAETIPARAESLQKLLNPSTVLERTLDAVEAASGDTTVLQKLNDTLKASVEKTSGKASASSEKRAHSAINGVMDAFDTVLREAVETASVDATDNAADTAIKKVMTLFEENRQQIATYLEGKNARIFSTALSDATDLIEPKLTDLLLDGVNHDETLVARALKETGELVESAREYKNTNKVLEMREHITNWTELLMNRFKKQSGESFNALAVLEENSALQRLSNVGYSKARIGAMALAAVSLGILVPKLQYAFTKRLTGKDEHPGLANLYGDDTAKEASSDDTQSASGSTSVSVLRGDSFAAFRRA